MSYNEAMDNELLSLTTTISGVSIVSLSCNSLRISLNKIHSFAEEVIPFYQELLGFYPHNRLEIIQGENDCDGGYPFKKGVIAIHGLMHFNQRSDSWWRWVTAHEIAHMYWGYYVLDKDPNPEDGELGWLTRGLGLYLDYQYMKTIVHDEQYHCKFMQHYLSITDKKSTSFFLTPEKTHDLSFDYNDVILHGRAYYVINEIEKILGHEKFMLIFMGLLREFKHKRLGYADLQDYIQKNYDSTFNYTID